MLLGIGTGVAVGLAGCTGNSGGGGAGTPAETPTPVPTETPTETETQTETPTGSGSVRVAHLSPNAPNVDVYVDGSAVLEDVPFGAVSSYLDVPAGDRQVEVTAAGDPDTSVFAGTVPVDADVEYTVAAVGELGEMAAKPFEPLVLTDDNESPGSETARVRLVHASPDAPAVDVTLAATGDVLYDGVAYGDSSAIEVPAGEYTLQVRGDTDGNDGDVVASFDVSLAGGQVYTAFAAGYLTPDDESATAGFDLLVAQDTEGGMMSQKAAHLRVAHLSPNAPNVDVYVDGAVALEDVAFGAVSGYLDLAPGAHTVEITAAGDPSTSVFEGEVTLDAGGAYTVAAIGELGDMADQSFRPLVLEDDNAAPDSGMARIRVVHTSPDAPAVDVTVDASGDALFDGVAFGEFGYVEVPASDYTVQIRGDTDGNDGDVVADFDVSLAGGQVYTAFAVGYLTPDDESADAGFDLILTQDTASTTE